MSKTVHSPAAPQTPTYWQGLAPIKAISLDLDDTLWPVLPTLINAEKTLSNWLSEQAPATARHLTSQTRQRLRESVVARYPDYAHDMSFIRLQLLREALTEAGDKPTQAEAAFEVFLAARQQVSLFDDVLPVLERWHQQFVLIAISNGNADLDRIGLGHLFQVKISAHQVGFAKPDERIFKLACEQADIESSNMLHIGDDHQLDYVAALDAGLQAAWLRRPELQKPGRPDTLIETARSAPRFVDLQSIDAQLRANP